MRGKGMAESVEWWGAINEIIKKQPKRIPKPQEQNQSSHSTVLPLPSRTLDEAPKTHASGNLIDDNSADFFAADLTSVTKKIQKLPQGETLGVSVQSKSFDEKQVPLSRPPPLPPSYADTFQNHSPLSNQSENSAFHSFQDESQSSDFKKMALADQMEMKLKQAVGKKENQIPTLPNVENFASFTDTSTNIKSPSNAWDTFQDDSGGW